MAVLLNQQGRFPGRKRNRLPSNRTVFLCCDNFSQILASAETRLILFLIGFCFMAALWSRSSESPPVSQDKGTEELPALVVSWGPDLPGPGLPVPHSRCYRPCPSSAHFLLVQGKCRLLAIFNHALNEEGWWWWWVRKLLVLELILQGFLGGLMGFYGISKYGKQIPDFTSMEPPSAPSQ